MMSLWNQIVTTSEQALRSGHLQPIPTRMETIPDQRIPFLVRIDQRLADKPKRNQSSQNALINATSFSPKGSPPGNNPFLPHDPELFVADISSTHFALLNKYNVVDHHLLIVTREFVHQSHPLQPSDFRALAHCMWQFPSLGFYNSAPAAGASQPHRHLQLVRLPLTEQSSYAIPIEARLPDDLPFTNWFYEVDECPGPDDLSHLLRQTYEAFRRDVGDTPYNLLATRDWVLFVPRSQECFEGISINALGFAGALFVKDRQQFNTLQMAGPMSALQTVAK